MVPHFSRTRALTLLLAASIGAEFPGDVARAKAPEMTTAQAIPEPERPAMPAGNTDPEMQVQGEWHITQVGATSIPEDAGLTVVFDYGSARFFGGCNTIEANPRFGPHSFKLEVSGTTKKLCDDEVMARETALVEAIAAVDLLTVGPGETLAFYDALNELVMVAARTAE